MRLGYFERFPDYLTQGESLSDLEENLRDLYRDLTGGEIPGIRSVAELAVERSESISHADWKTTDAC
jgi:predicted RNase H-like HicB family nuclease